MRLALRLLLAAAVLRGSALTAQSSVYSVLGLGFPSRTASVRAHAMGYGLTALDPGSTANPAAVAAFAQLTASVSGMASFRYFETDTLAVGNLQETRFPLAMLGGPIQATPLSFALSVTAFLDRSWDILTADTVIIRGAEVGVVDRRLSTGSVVDIRGAVGWQVSRSWRVGMGVHVLGGASRLLVRRSFSDSAYALFQRRSDVGFSGMGVSGGFMFSPVPQVRFGAAARWNGDLEAAADGEMLGRSAMPAEFTAGVFYAPSPSLQWATSASYATWSRTSTSLGGGGETPTFDTWTVGTGFEFGGPRFGRQRIPLRAGARYAQLPFAPQGTSEGPREISFSGGTGVALAGGRAIVDVAVERAYRDGGGARERAWQWLVEFRIRP